MSKTNGRNSRCMMSLLSSFTLKQSIESKCRLKSAKSFKNLKNCRSKRRAVLRPAKAKCRYKSVNEEEDETKLRKDLSESMPDVIRYNPVNTCTSESSLQGESCPDMPQYNISCSSFSKSNEDEKCIIVNPQPEENKINSEIEADALIKELSPVEVKKSTKSRESTPLKTIPFEVFEYDKSPLIFQNENSKIIKTRNCKSSKKLMNNTFKKQTKVISFCLSEEDLEEKENNHQLTPCKYQEKSNLNSDTNNNCFRHCRSIAPSDFKLALQVVNVDNEISESNNSTLRKIPLRERKKSFVGLNRLCSSERKSPINEKFKLIGADLKKELK